ncbi:GntR family transcriptional regulator [Amycolatopsis sp. lyj-112]|uniref:GntR family transcriptional regulator n=1 Tax=Amycolatopsis sp. lyj-112 TaxID=2789288 RepID=UPI00397E79EA
MVESRPASAGAATINRVVDTLRTRILEGALSPGAALREVSMSAELAVSRNSLREALRSLTSEGLIVQEPNKGAAVRLLEASDVRDIYRARRALETQAVLESSAADEDVFIAMEAAVAEKERAERDRHWRAAGTASLRFHQALVSVLGSDRVNEFFNSVLAQLRLAWGRSCDEAEFQRGWAERDRELLECLRQGRRTYSLGVLLLYLQDSERQVLDELRRTTGNRGK